MKIKVMTEGKKISLGIPTWLGLNYVTATIAPLFINKNIKKGGFKVTVKMCWKFVKVFYKTRKHFGGSFDLVDVEAKDGTLVKITL